MIKARVKKVEFTAQHAPIAVLGSFGSMVEEVPAAYHRVGNVELIVDAKDPNALATLMDSGQEVYVMSLEEYEKYLSRIIVE